MRFCDFQDFKTRKKKCVLFLGLIIHIFLQKTSCASDDTWSITHVEGVIYRNSVAPIVTMMYCQTWSTWLLQPLKPKCPSAYLACLSWEKKVPVLTVISYFDWDFHNFLQTLQFYPSWYPMYLTLLNCRSYNPVKQCGLSKSSVVKAGRSGGFRNKMEFYCVC